MVRKTEEVEAELVTYPSTAGERSGLLLPLDRYLLWLCRRGGRPGPQCSPAPSKPSIGPPKPAGTEPPIGPNPPRSLRPPKRPPGSRGSESGMSVNGRSSNNRCHSYKGGGIGEGRRQTWVGRKRDWGEESRQHSEKGWDDTKGGTEKIDFIKTHQITESKGFCLPFPILFYPKSHRAARTSAKCAAVSSIPLAPPSRRLRENAHKGTKDALLVSYTKPCTHVQV